MESRWFLSSDGSIHKIFGSSPRTKIGNNLSGHGPAQDYLLLKPKQNN
jgi:hypothetical protein